MATLKGGEKFVDKLREIAAAIRSADRVQMGFFSHSTYPNGMPVAMIALIQDSGAPSRGIPPRPFFRNMIAKNRPTWAPYTANRLKEKNYDAAATLTALGHELEGQLVDSINATNTPELKKATIARKGFAKPLVHTGFMRNSVHSEVKTS